jgi:hypothetical protein
MVTAGYIDGKPPHLHETAQWVKPDIPASCIFVAEWELFKSLSSLEVQEIFRHRHILIVNAPVETVDFDREGLETLGSLHSARTVQGSI